jgi:hypothetical protein
VAAEAVERRNGGEAKEDDLCEGYVACVVEHIEFLGLKIQNCADRRWFVVSIG